jgi:hypothetical protein
MPPSYTFTHPPVSAPYMPKSMSENATPESPLLSPAIAPELVEAVNSMTQSPDAKLCTDDAPALYAEGPASLVSVLLSGSTS